MLVQKLFSLFLSFPVYIYFFSCPVYNSLPPGCTMKPSPVDRCCQVPDCRYGSVVPVDQYTSILETIPVTSEMTFTPPVERVLKESFNERLKNTMAKSDVQAASYVRPVMDAMLSSTSGSNTHLQVGLNGTLLLSVYMREICITEKNVIYPFCCFTPDSNQGGND